MRAFIIRIRGNEFSESLADQCYEKGVELGYEIERFDAIYRPPEIARRFLQEGLVSSHGAGDIATNWGTQGCFVSHFTLWQRCVEMEEPVVIMEHDAVPVRNCTSLVGQVEHVCHLDSALPFSSDPGTSSESHFKDYERHARRTLEPGVREYKTSKFYGDTETTGYFFKGAYGYLLTPEGAARVIEFCRTNGAFPADHCLCERALRLQRSNSTYVRLNPFFKSLGIQRKHTTRVN